MKMKNMIICDNSLSRYILVFNFKSVLILIEPAGIFVIVAYFQMSKKRKGLSLEEKRDKLLEVYYDKKEVLNLKEIEKYGAKKGVVLQTIKDVNQSLIDDNLVETDKIGIGAFFWAFPSKGF